MCALVMKNIALRLVIKAITKHLAKLNYGKRMSFTVPLEAIINLILLMVICMPFLVILIAVLIIY